MLDTAKPRKLCLQRVGRFQMVLGRPCWLLIILLFQFLDQNSFELPGQTVPVGQDLAMSLETNAVSREQAGHDCFLQYLKINQTSFLGTLVSYFLTFYCHSGFLSGSQKIRHEVSSLGRSE